MKRTVRPAFTRKMREIDEMTGGRLPRAELRKAAENSKYIDGELCFYADAVRILLEYSPLDPVMKELRKSQFEAAISGFERKRAEPDESD